MPRQVFIMELKNILIFGDSYSTFDGYIPKGFLPYYSTNSKVTDVRNVEQTWWYRLIKKTGACLVQNNSWSGSTICNTGYDGDCSKTNSFICRLNKLIEEDFFKNSRIDNVFIFGATNDSWANAPIGGIMYSDWKNEDLFSVLPAVSYFINKVKSTLPDATVTVIINTELKDSISLGMKEICEHYNVNYIVLKDIDKIGGHPTVKGMQQIEDQIISNL